MSTAPRDLTADTTASLAIMWLANAALRQDYSSLPEFLAHADAAIAAHLWAPAPALTAAQPPRPLLPRQQAVADRLLHAEIDAASDDSPVSVRLRTRARTDTRQRGMREVEPLRHRRHPSQHHSRPWGRQLLKLRLVGRARARGLWGGL